MGQTPDQTMTIAGLRLSDTGDRNFELDAILHPDRVFAHPSDVVRDPGLSIREKRAILASWASDACAIESAPTLRSSPASRRPVRFDEVMDALRMLDGGTSREAGGTGRREPRRRRAPLPFRQGRIWRGFRGSGSDGEPNSGVPSAN